MSDYLKVECEKSSITARKLVDSYVIEVRYVDDDDIVRLPYRLMLSNIIMIYGCDPAYPLVSYGEISFYMRDGAEVKIDCDELGFDESQTDKVVRFFCYE